MKTRNIVRIMTITLALVLMGTLTGCDFFGSLFGGEEDGAITLTNIEPNWGIMNELLDVSITGNPLSNDMSPNLQPRLIQASTILYGENVNYITGGQITTSFTLTVSEPMTMDVYVIDDDGDEGTLVNSFNIHEYEVLQDPRSTTIDLSGGDQAYDFSQNAGCVIDALSRDVTFQYNGGSPAISITAGGSGCYYYYTTPFSSISEATVSGLESRLSHYGYAGDSAFPITLVEGDCFSFDSVAEDHKFIVMKVGAVTSDSVPITYMIVRLMETTD